MSTAITVDVGVDSKRFSKGLDAMRARAKKFRQGLARAGGLLGGAAAAGGAATLRNVFREMDRIHKLGQRFDLDTTFLQQLSFASEQSGADLEQAAKFMQKLVESTQRSTGMDAYADAYRVLNLEVNELKTLRPDELLQKVADATKDNADRQETLNALLEVGGKAAGEMLPLLQEGAEGLKELGDQVEVISPEDVALMAQYNDELNRMKTNFKVGFAKGFLDFKERATLAIQGAVETGGVLFGLATGNKEIVDSFSGVAVELARERQEAREKAIKARKKAKDDADQEALDAAERAAADANAKDVIARLRAQILPVSPTEPVERQLVFDRFRNIGGNLGGSFVRDTDKQMVEIQKTIAQELKQLHDTIKERQDQEERAAVFNN